MLGIFMIGSRSHIGRWALLSAVAVAGCADEKCTVTTTQYTTSVTTVGYVGPTLGKPVARFDLTQDFISHEPYAACAQGPLQDVGAVRLSVTSTATAPLAIEYDVQGLNADSIPVWSQPGLIQRIMPGETVEVGQISVSPTHVDHGARVILKSVNILP
jgi:hypothetical protein